MLNLTVTDLSNAILRGDALCCMRHPADGQGFRHLKTSLQARTTLGLRLFGAILVVEQ